MQSNQIVTVRPEAYTDGFRDANGVASIMCALKIGFKNTVNIVKSGGGGRMMSNSRYMCLLLLFFLQFYYSPTSSQGK